MFYVLVVITSALTVQAEIRLPQLKPIVQPIVRPMTKSIENMHHRNADSSPRESTAMRNTQSRPTQNRPTRGVFTKALLAKGSAVTAPRKSAARRCTQARPTQSLIGCDRPLETLRPSSTMGHTNFLPPETNVKTSFQRSHIAPQTAWATMFGIEGDNSIGDVTTVIGIEGDEPEGLDTQLRAEPFPQGCAFSVALACIILCFAIISAVLTYYPVISTGLKDPLLSP